MTTYRQIASTDIATAGGVLAVGDASACTVLPAGATAPMTLAMRSSTWSTVYDYGASGSGVTDDKPAFDGLATHIASTGGVGVIPQGNYNLSNWGGSALWTAGNAAWMVLPGVSFSSTGFPVGTTDGTAFQNNTSAFGLIKCTNSSSNANTLAVQHNVTSQSGAGSYEKCGIVITVNTSDSSDYANGYIKDVAGIESHANINGTVTGRVWGYSATVSIASGSDGYGIIYEGGITNNGTDHNAFDVPTTTYGARMLSSGSAQNTCAFMADASGGQPWHFGFVARASGASDYSFGVYQGGPSPWLFTVTPAGAGFFNGNIVTAADFSAMGSTHTFGNIGQTSINLNGSASNSKLFRAMDSGKTRLLFGADATGDFTVQPYASDGATSPGIAFEINNSNGLVSCLLGASVTGGLTTDELVTTGPLILAGNPLPDSLQAVPQQYAAYDALHAAPTLRGLRGRRDLPALAAATAPIIGFGPGDSFLAPGGANPVTPMVSLASLLARAIVQANPSKTWVTDNGGAPSAAGYATPNGVLALGGQASFPNWAIGGMTLADWLPGTVALPYYPEWYPPLARGTGLSPLVLMQAAQLTAMVVRIGGNDMQTLNGDAYKQLLKILGSWGALPPIWAAATAYTVGTVIKDTGNRLNVCIAAGTSGSGAPTFTNTLWGTTTDGGVTWLLLTTNAWTPGIPDLILISNEIWNPVIDPAFVNPCLSAAALTRTLALSSANVGHNADLLGVASSGWTKPGIGLIDCGAHFAKLIGIGDPTRQSMTLSTAYPQTFTTQPIIPLPQCDGDFAVTITIPAATGAAMAAAGTQLRLAVGDPQGGAIAITSATWAGGEITFNLAQPSPTVVSVPFTIVNCVPSSLNGTYTAQAGTGGTVLVGSLTSNPGVMTAAGYCCNFASSPVNYLNFSMTATSAYLYYHLTTGISESAPPATYWYSGAPIAVTNAVWSSAGGGSGYMTYTTASAHGVAVGGLCNISGVSPAGANGQFIALAGTAGSTLVVAMSANPGAYVSGGMFSADNQILVEAIQESIRVTLNGHMVMNRVYPRHVSPFGPVLHIYQNPPSAYTITVNSFVSGTMLPSVPSMSAAQAWGVAPFLQGGQGTGTLSSYAIAASTASAIAGADFSTA